MRNPSETFLGCPNKFPQAVTKQSDCPKGEVLPRVWASSAHNGNWHPDPTYGVRQQNSFWTSLAWSELVWVQKHTTYMGLSPKGVSQFVPPKTGWLPLFPVFWHPKKEPSMSLTKSSEALCYLVLKHIIYRNSPENPILLCWLRAPAFVSVWGVWGTRQSSRGTKQKHMAMRRQVVAFLSWRPRQGSKSCSKVGHGK